MLKRLFIATVALAAIGCGDNGTSPVTGGSTNSGGGGTTTVTYRQIEQLARPAVAEGLLFSNDLLSTYNAVGPSFVAAALAGQEPQATQAGPVLTQAQTVLNLTTGFVAGGFTTGQIVTAMLPDVMRIDTKINMAVATEAYSFTNAAHINGVNSPIAGRKLLDDVVDQTYGALVGPGVTDNVPYYPTANPGVGHQNLNGQTVQNGAATFPFLAPPN